ncbi:MAG: virB8 family protein [Janthinobacterium lividum]
MIDPRAGREAYYADAASWSQDVNGALRASRRRAWWVASGAALIAVCEALALAALSPLKTVVPYTITVDRQTGAAQLARGVNLGAMSENEALIQSALAQYVIARESLDATDLAANYRKVGLWSAGTARSDYLRAMDRNNPASVLIGATAATEIATTITSITQMSPTTALVRFTTDRREGDGPVARMNYAAVVQFAFTGGPLSMEDRLVNPLGFQVTHYRRDAESSGPQIIAPPPAPQGNTAPQATTTTTTTRVTIPTATTVVIPSRLITEPAR